MEYLPGITFNKIAIYKSNEDAPSCYELAALYADTYESGRAFVNTEYLLNELIHFTTNGYEATPTELELIQVCTQVLPEGYEWLLVVED